MQVVWFKRDLRIHDHEALAQAARRGPVLPLYVIEPELWAQADMSGRHYAFLLECLAELNAALSKLGQPLIVRVGNVTDILAQLHAQHPIDALWSHQETWNGWTYARDIKVKQWLASQGIPWYEPLQFGVIRRLNNRDGWAGRWQRLMQQNSCPAPDKLTPLPPSLVSQALPSAQSLGLGDDDCPQRQRGGRSYGLQRLQAFLYDDGEHYSKAMSSPVTAFDSCSRLSPYLAFGALSLREVFHATQARQQQLKPLPASERGKWLGAMRSFSGRLRWHCHFMQKLEDEPRLELANMHPAYDGLREHDFNEAHFAAWQTGRTGLPMVDACMRALIATGWLNFRMRAMLMSFASYHLWLHWRRPALHLARLFTDYEPGIHYSQSQMQSGTTGINSIRIYNPVKQGLDHDPDGLFIRQWIPELANMPTSCIHTPWQAPALMGEYPMPIVDLVSARKAAADRIYGLRKQSDHRQIAKHIVQKHGSRKATTSPKNKQKTRRNTTKNAANPRQGELPL